MRLDKKDRKILYEMDRNSRQSYQRMGRKVGLSKESVAYRVGRMKREGIIKNFHAIVDVGKLGLVMFRFYVSLRNTTPSREREIVEFLKSQKEVVWMVSMDGEYDIGLGILVSTIDEMNDIWERMLRKYLNNLDKRFLAIMTKISYFPRAYLIGEKRNADEYVFVTKPKKENIDAKDMGILSMLAKDARIQVTEIAKQLNITAKTAARRIKDLERKNVIVAYRTSFDLNKLGYKYFKLHIDLNSVTGRSKTMFHAYAKQHPNIIYDNRVLGGDDIELEIEAASLEELRSIIDDIKKRFGKIITSYRYMIFYKEHKYVLFPA